MMCCPKIISLDDASSIAQSEEFFFFALNDTSCIAQSTPTTPLMAQFAMAICPRYICIFFSLPFFSFHFKITPVVNFFSSPISLHSYIAKQYTTTQIYILNLRYIFICGMPIKVGLVMIHQRKAIHGRDQHNTKVNYHATSMGHTKG